MTDSRTYYEAYDDRYRQVHGEQLRWFSDAPSPIVAQTISEYGIPCHGKLLEIGCGEGRDAGFLLNQGFSMLATDISPEAISYCQKEYPRFATSFQVLDCVKERLDAKFDFIYAVAVIHMLVLDADRNAFYRFFREHLTQSGIGLICTMGDGRFERQSDISNAFTLQERTHEPTGRTVFIAGTSCRMVSFETFSRELKENRLATVKQGITSIEPDFPQMMYAVVKRKG